MIFLFPRWDMLVFCRVTVTRGSKPNYKTEIWSLAYTPHTQDSRQHLDVIYIFRLGNRELNLHLPLA